MNYSLNVKSSSIVHTLLSNCVKLLGKVQKLLIKCISYSVISKRIRVVSPKFYTARKNFTGPPVPTVPTNLKSAHSVWHTHKIQILLRWITRRGFLQCKYAFLVCQPGIKSTCGGGQHKIILGQHYIVTLKWIVWSQLWILGDYTTHATQFSEISSGFLIQSDQ